MRHFVPSEQISFSIFKVMQKILVLLILLLSHSVQAGMHDSHYNSARMLATGRSGVAAAGRNIEDVYVLNPALLATKVTLSAFASYTTGEDSFGDDQRQFSVGLLDSTSGTWDPNMDASIADFRVFPLASALTYTNIKNDFYRDQTFTLGIAQAMSKNLAIGILGNYSRASMGSGAKETFFDLGVGFVYRWRTRLSLGLSAQNLLDSRKDEGLPFLRRAIGVGAQFRLVEFAHLRADVWNAKDLSDENQWIYRVGLENQFTDHFHLNFGVGRDNVLKTNIIAGGFSIIGPRLSLHYGVQRETSKDNLLHSVDFHLPLW